MHNLLYVAIQELAEVKDCKDNDKDYSNDKYEGGSLSNIMETDKHI